MSIPTEQAEKPGNPDSSQQVASMRHVLKNRYFVLLWMAQLLSLTVLNAANFGLVALVNKRPNDGTFLANLAIITFTLPAVPFSAIAGVIVDRMNKRGVLWVSNLLRLITMLMMFFSLVYDRGNIWPLFALLFLTSLIGQFFIPAESASIPLLVGSRELMPALSLFNITITISQAIGFLLLGRLVLDIFRPFDIHLGSLVLHTEPTDMLFVVVAALYGVCIALILAIPQEVFHEKHLKHYKGEERDIYNVISQALGSLWRDLVAGWRIITVDRLLFLSVILVSVVGIIMQLIAGLAGTFVQVILSRPVEDMTFILAPAAFGLVGASIFMPRITERVGKIRLTFVGLISLAVGFILIPIFHWIALQFDPHHGSESPLLFWAIILLVFCLGIGVTTVNIPTVTMMQERAPEEGRARVISLQYMLYSAGTIPILLFAGTIAQLFGFSLIVFIVSAAILLVCVWSAWYLRRNDKNKEHLQQQDVPLTTESDIQNV